jgi:TELO2-interacting protein 1
MLCGSVVGGVGGKEKDKERDDETKLAAVKCLWALLHSREDDVASKRLQELKEHAKSSEIIPIVGQTINHLLGVIPSTNKLLQRESLRVLKVLISVYIPPYLGPSILPGVASSMTRVALGGSENKGWANGDIVELALQVLQDIIIISISDDICIQEGAVKDSQTLEDLIELATESNSQKPSNKNDIPRYATARTSSWVAGASSQLHIALNRLMPLVAHPNPSALVGLSQLSSVLLAKTSLTLSKSHPLLLSFLLSISNNSYPTPSSHARQALVDLLNPSSKGHHNLVKILIRLTRDNISSLPQLIVSHADSKVEHVSGLIEATCRIYEEKTDRAAANVISRGIGSLLGSSGGIEKWGWGLLSVLEFTDLPTPSIAPSAARLSLESDPSSTTDMGFPEIALRHIQSRSTIDSVTRMFRSLGSCGGEECLYAVEWFTDVGRNSMTSSSPAALWCAAHLLEGIGGVDLDAQNNRNAFQLRGGKRIEKFARGLARSLAEIWDQPNGDIGAKTGAKTTSDIMPSNDTLLSVEHKVGLVDIRATASVETPTGFLRDPIKDLTPLQHGLALRLLSTAAAILQSRFTPLLLHTLYPILHSIVSSNGFLSSTGLVSLHFVTNNTGYASPANLLLSNFDYALDAISHRLTRRWLDVDATKVLILLVRLVGSDIVHKAGDVVEECFDRLDDFHGYDVLVDGLVEVLSEVVKAVESDTSAVAANPSASDDHETPKDDDAVFIDALEWFTHRNDPLSEEEATDYGPAPREAWGKGKAKDMTALEEENDGEGDGLTPELPPDADAEPAPTPAQALTKQIVDKSIYFLTHSSAVIRMRILLLLSSSVPVLSESALLTSIHQAWPFIMNRLSDPEPFVVRAAAALVEALTLHVGSFMYRRIWDDVWPRFHVMLMSLDNADSASALMHRRGGTADPSSAYTHAHRLYRSLLKTMAAAVNGVETKDNSLWEVILAFRRFLDKAAHEELQRHARTLYISAKHKNEDAVWLALSATTSQLTESDSYNGMEFLVRDSWSLQENMREILGG